MTNRASGAQHMSALVGLGVLFLLGAIALLLRGVDTGSSVSGNAPIATLLMAQTTIRAANIALATGSEQAYADLVDTGRRLAAASQRGSGWPTRRRP